MAANRPKLPATLNPAAAEISAYSVPSLALNQGLNVFTEATSAERVSAVVVVGMTEVAKPVCATGTMLNVAEEPVPVMAVTLTG